MMVSDSIEVTELDLNALSETKLMIEGRLERLRSVVPSILDLSCRECALPASYGHTLEDKKALFKLVREFGFHDLMVSNFFDFRGKMKSFFSDVEKYFRKKFGKKNLRCYIDVKIRARSNGAIFRAFPALLHT